MAGQFGLRFRLPRKLQGSFTCRKSATWDRQLYFPSEGRHAVNFFARKIQRLRSGSNPRSWGPEAGMLTTRPLKPLTVYLLLKNVPKSTSVWSSSFPFHLGSRNMFLGCSFRDSLFQSTTMTCTNITAECTFYQNPRNAVHKIMNLHSENKKTTQIAFFLERIQFVHLLQK
jgi:hypothetical protein